MTVQKRDILALSAIERSAGDLGAEGVKSPDPKRPWQITGLNALLDSCRRLLGNDDGLALLPDPTGDDEKGFTDAQFDMMRAGEGRALFEALREAAGRGVSIRILQSPGFSGQKQESDALKEEFPEKVTIHSVEMGKWYGGSGIMHQKSAIQVGARGHAQHHGPDHVPAHRSTAPGERVGFRVGQPGLVAEPADRLSCHQRVALLADVETLNGIGQVVVTLCEAVGFSHHRRHGS